MDPPDIALLSCQAESLQYALEELVGRLDRARRGGSGSSSNSSSSSSNSNPDATTYPPFLLNSLLASARSLFEIVGELYGILGMYQRYSQELMSDPQVDPMLGIWIEGCADTAVAIGDLVGCMEEENDEDDDEDSEEEDEDSEEEGENSEEDEETQKCLDGDEWTLVEVRSVASDVASDCKSSSRKSDGWSEMAWEGELDARSEQTAVSISDHTEKDDEEVEASLTHLQLNLQSYASHLGGTLPVMRRDLSKCLKPAHYRRVAHDYTSSLRRHLYALRDKIHDNQTCINELISAGCPMEIATMLHSCRYAQERIIMALTELLTNVGSQWIDSKLAGKMGFTEFMQLDPDRIYQFVQEYTQRYDQIFPVSWYITKILSDDKEEREKYQQEIRQWPNVARSLAKLLKVTDLEA